MSGRDREKEKEKITAIRNSAQPNKPPVALEGIDLTITSSFADTPEGCSLPIVCQGLGLFIIHWSPPTDYGANEACEVRRDVCAIYTPTCPINCVGPTHIIDPRR